MAFDVRAAPGRRRRVAWLAGGLAGLFALLWLLVALQWAPLVELDRELARRNADVVGPHRTLVDVFAVVSVL